MLFKYLTSRTWGPLEEWRQTLENLRVRVSI